MSVEENKSVARKYHDLKVEDMDQILTPGFIGRQPDGGTWSLEDHKKHWAGEDWRGTKDTIHQQVAEGDWVATRFTRAWVYRGKHLDLAMMHLKRFEGGKIAELWEWCDTKQMAEWFAA